MRRLNRYCTVYKSMYILNWIQWSYELIITLQYFDESNASFGWRYHVRKKLTGQHFTKINENGVWSTTNPLHNRHTKFTIHLSMQHTHQSQNTKDKNSSFPWAIHTNTIQSECKWHIPQKHQSFREKKLNCKSTWHVYEYHDDNNKGNDQWIFYH